MLGKSEAATMGFKGQQHETMQYLGEPKEARGRLAVYNTN
jgi:hypothetical protein